jgi:CBS domain-containing protein
VTVDGRLSVREVVETMRKERVGTVVVVEGPEPAGLLSDRDIALQVLIDRLDAGAVQARELMRSPVVTVPEETPLADAAQVLRTNGRGRLPVADKEGKLVGMIGSDDLVGVLSRSLAGLASAIAHQRPTTKQLESDIT